MDLSRSVRLLEDALSPHGRSLLRTHTPKKLKDTRRNIDPSLDLTITLSAEEMKRLMDDTDLCEATGLDNTLNYMLQNSTITGSAINNNKPWENATDALFMEYLEVIRSHSSAQEIFETVSDLARCCTDTLNVVKGLKSKVRFPVLNDKWLENERNTWRLIFCLYQDRLNSDFLENKSLMPYLGVSEKLCVENLYKRDALIRESQLIIDWLECSALDDESNEQKVQYFTDRTVGWENSLHQLQSSDSIVFKSTRSIVTSLDPDAPNRDGLPLHDLDMEDEERLSKKIFREIRCGRMEEAQDICMHCGHPWKAALLEGWRLYHDPNLSYDTDNKDEAMDIENKLTVENIQEKMGNQTNNQLKRVEGNMNRDIWKNVAWQYCQQVSKIIISVVFMVSGHFTINNEIL